MSAPIDMGTVMNPRQERLQAAVRQEYMRGDEYLLNPTGFMLRRYLPRVASVYERLAAAGRVLAQWIDARRR